MNQAFSPLSQRIAAHGQWLALGLLLLLLLSIWSLIIEPWRDQRAAYRYEIESSQTVLDRYRRAVVRTRAEIEAAAQLKDDPALFSGFLDPGDAGLAAAALQTRIKDTAAKFDITLTSLQVLPPTTRGAVREIRVAVNLETQTEPLIRLIHDLENADPLVRIEAIEAQRSAEEGDALRIGMEAIGLVPEAPL